MGYFSQLQLKQTKSLRACPKSLFNIKKELGRPISLDGRV